MKKRRSLFISCISLVVGMGFGAFASQYWVLLDDFPRVMNLNVAITEGLNSVPPATGLRLLDVYEGWVRRQTLWIGSRKFWQQELVELELKRYVLYSNEDHPELADKALDRAVALRRHGTSSNGEDKEVLRQVAIRAYGPK
jgi:hypothetical protein